jgi:MFS family permease
MTYPRGAVHRALIFVILLGVISFCADITSDGARSIIGPYLGLLGASSSIVGFVAGLSELVSYGLRVVSGYIIDLTGRHWTLAVIGYGITLLAVPLMGLAGHWEYAAILIVVERVGKAIRTPARDTMLSHATILVGRGWGFGLHKLLDQLGAMLGPLVVTAILFFKGSYQQSLFVLLIPAILAIAIIIFTGRHYQHPEDLEIEAHEPEQSNRIDRSFWLYLAGALLVAAGYVDFPLIAFHFQKEAIFSPVWIPVLYSIALGVSGITALFFGYLFDRDGFYILAIVVILSAAFVPMVFLGGFALAIVGMALWGLGMGAQISIMRAIIANMIPMHKRGSASGIFNAGFGIFWFLGSAFMGIIYSISIMDLIVFSMALQLASIPLFLIVKKKLSKKSGMV